MWKAEQNGKGHKCHRKCESEAQAELQDFPSKVSSKSSAKYTEPWGRRSAWACCSQHWSAWLSSNSRSWSQWQTPLIKIPAVPASQTARQRRLKAAISSFPGAPALGVPQQNGALLTVSTSNLSLYKPVLSRTLCFLKSKEIKQRRSSKHS